MIHSIKHIQRSRELSKDWDDYVERLSRSRESSCSDLDTEHAPPSQGAHVQNGVNGQMPPPISRPRSNGQDRRLLAILNQSRYLEAQDSHLRQDMHLDTPPDWEIELNAMMANDPEYSPDYESLPQHPPNKGATIRSNRDPQPRANHYNDHTLEMNGNYGVPMNSHSPSPLPPQPPQHNHHDDEKGMNGINEMKIDDINANGKANRLSLGPLGMPKVVVPVRRAKPLKSLNINEHRKADNPMQQYLQRIQHPQLHQYGQHGQHGQHQPHGQHVEEQSLQTPQREMRQRRPHQEPSIHPIDYDHTSRSSPPALMPMYEEGARSESSIISSSCVTSVESPYHTVDYDTIGFKVEIQVPSSENVPSAGLLSSSTLKPEAARSRASATTQTMSPHSPGTDTVDPPTVINFKLYEDYESPTIQQDVPIKSHSSAGDAIAVAIEILEPIYNRSGRTLPS